MSKKYVAKKHWWFWILPISYSLIFLLLATIWQGMLLFIVWIMIWAILRWKFDKIEMKEGCLYSKMGIIFIDKKTIPLEQISFVSEKMDIISQLLGFACIQVNSSAYGKAIEYPCIANSSEFVKTFNEFKTTGVSNS